ncbi:ATP-binding protein [Singulisphaera sp. GP187]|uniref:ATP-binding protein n=1 Tax=Singulisphaera sp. GP187 TaxID=1882752 RepID=UPI0039655EEF
MFGDDVLATAILDRPHHNHTLMVTSESDRLRQNHKSSLFRTRLASANPNSEEAPRKRPKKSR